MLRSLRLALVLVLTAGCSSDSTSPPPENVDLPDPISVTAADIPEPGDGIFYNVRMSPGDDPEPTFLAAFRNGVDLRAAWHPRTESPCGAPTATAALVVRASCNVGWLLQHEFLANPGHWIVNCGVDSFWKYDFGDGARGQEFLFEIAYENHAWGRQINGHFIDSQGRVFRYDHNHADWHPAGSSHVTGAELREKFANPVQVGTVDMAILNSMTSLISTAAAGQLSDPVGRCADAGARTFLAYEYSLGLYRPVVLYTAGDVAQKNLSDSAETLYRWLFTIGGEPDICLP